MASQTKKANVVTQYANVEMSDKQTSTFNNLDGLKKDESPATCSIEASTGQSVYIPQIELTDFGFNIPKNAVIDSIVVEYSQKCSTTSIPAPYITAKNLDGAVGIGDAPATAYKNSTLKIKSLDMGAHMVDPELINNGFIISFFWNRNTGAACSFEIKNISVTVNYTEARFDLAVTSDIPDVYAGETFPIDISLTLEWSYNDSEVDVIIEPSSLLNIIENNSVKKTADGTYKWIASFEHVSKKTDSCQIVVNPRSGGEHKVKITEKGSNTSREIVFSSARKSTWITWGIGSKIELGKQHESVIYNVDNENNTRPRECTLSFPSSFDIYFDGVKDGTVEIIENDDETVIEWSIPAETSSSELYITITPYQYGHHILKAYDSAGRLISTKDVTVLNPDYSLPYFAKYECQDKTYDLLGDGVEYTAVSYLRFIPTVNVDEAYVEYEDLDDNFRFCVCNIDDAGLDDSEKIANSVKTEFIPLGNDWYEARVKFYYFENYPVTLYWTGEFLEKDTSLINVLFSTPILVESRRLEEKQKMEEYGNYVKPLKNLLTETEYGSVEIAARKASNPFITYRIDSNGIDDSENFALQGIKIYFDYISSSNCGVNVRVYNKGQLAGQRSVMLKAFEGTASIGGVFDIMGLKYTDVDRLDDLEFEFEVINPYNDVAKIDITNIRYEISWSILDNQEWAEFWINGESSTYYNCFLTDLTILGGSDSTVDSFNVHGTDKHKAYRQAIDSKKLKLEFSIDSCWFEDASLLFERAARWFMNKRDKYNRPIENTIEFKHLPDIQFKYILEDAIDEEVVEGGNYDCKATLLVPSGTAESKEDKITNDHGINEGIAKVTPIISILAINSEIAITETSSNQVMNLENYADIRTSDIIVVDCESRKAIRYRETDDGYNEVDVTSSIEFDSDWFVIFPKEPYQFDVVGGTIQSIDFRERW